MKILDKNKTKILNFKIIRRMLKGSEFTIEFSSGENDDDLVFYAVNKIGRGGEKLDKGDAKKLNTFKIHILAGKPGSSSEKIDGTLNDFTSVFLGIEIIERNIKIEIGFVDFKKLCRFLTSPNELCKLFFSFI